MLSQYNPILHTKEDIETKEEVKDENQAQNYQVEPFQF